MGDLDAHVIVVGGGPAGSVSAALLAQQGWQVILLDRARFPRHKACSEYVNPAGARILSQLGLEPELAGLGADRLDGMAFYAPGGECFRVQFEIAGASARAIGLTRWRLDNLLLDHARGVGVDVREGARVRDVLVDGGRATGVVATANGVRRELRAALTIGADGHHSIVSGSLGLASASRWPRHTGLVAHYEDVPALAGWGEIHVAAGFYAGLAPLEAGLTNVALVASSAAVARRDGPLETWFEERLRRFPRIAQRLAGARRVGSIRGVGGMAQRSRRVSGSGFLLVGDAAGFLDPITGDGIYAALRGATLAAPIADAALRAGDVSVDRLAPYGDAHRQHFAAKRRLGLLVQGFLVSPRLMDYAVDRLARRQLLATTLSGALVDFTPAQDALSPVYLARLLRP